MNNKLKSKLIELARALHYCPVGDQKHFSFIVLRNKVISIGWNNKVKSNPLNQKYGYRYDKPHSELIAIKNFPYPNKELSRHTLVNVRIGRANDVIMCKPCMYCQNLLKTFNIKEVYYTNAMGNFIRL